MFVLSLARRLGAALLLCSALSAQAIETLQPGAVAPGALLTLAGRELGDVQLVRFTALGPGDTLLVREAPVLRAGDSLMVVVPAFADTGSAPLSPWGWVGVAGAPPQPLFLLEGTGGRVRVTGAGTQRAEGERLTVSFDPASGPPVSGNAGFKLTLYGAPAGAPAMVLAGPPASGSRRRLRDAALGLDLASSFLLAGSCVTGADGRAELLLPVPAVSGVGVAAMWAVVTPEGQMAFSDTLVACL
jgi:hypothetical protein